MVDRNHRQWRFYVDIIETPLSMVAVKLFTGYIPRV
jgi:hypothetical protein